MVIVMKATVYGVGINDADYPVARKVGGTQVMCSIYSTWRNMLKRCYCEKSLEAKPTYRGCTVCDEWLVFSNFKSWMGRQQWKGRALDKDIIKKGNKVYCPEFCAFVDPVTNSFVADAAEIRGEFHVGVYFYKRYQKFSVNCGNPFTRGRDFLGYFDSEKEAAAVYLSKKKEHAIKLAEHQADKRVADALLNLY